MLIAVVVTGAWLLTLVFAYALCAASKGCDALPEPLADGPQDEAPARPAIAVVDEVSVHRRLSGLAELVGARSVELRRVGGPAPVPIASVTSRPGPRIAERTLEVIHGPVALVAECEARRTFTPLERSLLLRAAAVLAATVELDLPGDEEGAGEVPVQAS